jgi:hypothetical protein
LVTAVRRKPRCDAGDCHHFGRWKAAAAYTIWCCSEIKMGGGSPELGVNVVQKDRGSLNKTTMLIDQLE